MSAPQGQLGIGTSLDAPYEEAVSRVREALKEEGFGVLTEIDVKATLKEKLGADFKRYVILGACNPPLAHRALSAEDDIGLLLPCNVVVYESDGGSVVKALNPLTMAGFCDSDPVRTVAHEAHDRIQRCIACLSQGTR